MCTGLEIAAVAGTALSTREAIRAPKRGKTGQPKPPPDLEGEREEARKRGARARARASGGFGNRSAQGLASASGGKTLLGG
jgi:hypothetical protein